MKEMHQENNQNNDKELVEYPKWYDLGKHSYSDDESYKKFLKKMKLIINEIQDINEVMHDVLSDVDIYSIRDLDMEELLHDKMVKNETKDEN